MLIRVTEGYCPCCDSETLFVSKEYWLRDYYGCIKCKFYPKK